MNNDFNDWYDGAPVDFGTLAFSFDYWYDGAPVPLFTTDYSVTADSGAFALSGGNVGFSIGHVMAADLGSFALTGNDASFSVVISVGLEAGSFLLSGQNATLTYSGFNPPEPPVPPIVTLSGGMYSSVGRPKRRRRKKEAESAPQPEAVMTRRLFGHAMNGEFSLGGGRIQTIFRSPEEEDLAEALILIFGD